MTETQITFADINVGDKIRSVSPCGTERVGVVAFMSDRAACDADEWYETIARFDWTIYRIEPAFTPLPIPEEGQWIRATLRGGDVVEGAVEYLSDRTSDPLCWAWLVDIGGVAYFIDTDARAMESSNDIIAWEPIDPPAPPEPDWFGYVGYVTDKEGTIRDAIRRMDGTYLTVRRNSGLTLGIMSPLQWPTVLTLGTFTAVKP